jgi:hypothetical protein
MNRIALAFVFGALAIQALPPADHYGYYLRSEFSTGRA